MFALPFEHLNIEIYNLCRNYNLVIILYVDIYCYIVTGEIHGHALVKLKKYREMKYCIICNNKMKCNEEFSVRIITANLKGGTEELYDT